MDLILLSSDGTQFHIHAVVLRLASGVFKDMFAVKRPDGDGPITLDESKATLSTLLDMSYPSRRAPPTMSVSHFRDVATAAEKYDMPNVTSTLKDFILGRNTTTTLVSEHNQTGQYIVIEEYFLTWNLGWTSVAKELSPKTLSSDLNSEIAQNSLFSADGVAAKELISLHRQRRIWIYNALIPWCFKIPNS